MGMRQRIARLERAILLTDTKKKEGKITMKTRDIDILGENSDPKVCALCGDPADEKACGHFCWDCRNKYPDTLLKAMVDPFEYLIVTKSGLSIYFHEIREFIGGEWLFLVSRDYRDPDAGHDRDGVEVYGGDFGDNPFQRGVRVRYSEVVLIVDAPNGS